MTTIYQLVITHDIGTNNLSVEEFHFSTWETLSEYLKNKFKDTDRIVIRKMTLDPVLNYKEI